MFTTQRRGVDDVLLSMQNGCVLSLFAGMLWIQLKVMWQPWREIIRSNFPVTEKEKLERMERTRNVENGANRIS